MSTYTDLKNRVKETITVGFRPEDRITTQKVRFYNEENEYYGSFSGSLSGENINIHKGKLSAVDIYDATLVNPVIKTSDGVIIELGSIAEQLEELSVYAYDDLSGAISSCVNSIREIRNAISSVPTDTADQLSAISSIIEEINSSIDFEISARISADQVLSEELKQRIVNLAALMAEEDSKLQNAILGLSNGLSNEISARISANSDISAFTMSYADRRRHYEIYPMDAAPQMPIKAKEFAVNRLTNYDLPNGFVVDAREQLVGYVEGYDAATGDCAFVAYSDANYQIADETGVTEFPYTQILGHNQYSFDSSVQTRQCPDSVHELVYMRAAGGNFEDNYFDIRMLMPNMRTVKYHGKTIGYVYNAGSENSVSAGILQFIPSELAGNPVLSSFANDAQVPFSILVNGGKISDDALYPNCDLRLISSIPAFNYRAQLSSWKLKLLDDGFEDYSARVYKDLWSKEDGELVSRFAVSMIPEHDKASGQQDFYLNAEDGFLSVLHTYDDKSYDVLEYDERNNVISYYNEKKYLSCLVRVVDSGRQYDLQLSSLEANTDLIQAQSAQISFMQLSNAINERLYPLITAEPYVLNRANGVLSCETATHIAGDDEDSNVIIQIYDNETIFVSFRRPDGNALVLGDNDYVDFSRQGAYDDQTRTYGECAFDADNVDFDQDPPEERCAEEGNFSIGSAAGEGDEYTHLAFKREYSKNGRREYNVNDIVIEIPDKSAGSIESREFLFVMRPLGQSGQKATIKFVTPQGEPIDFFGLETRPEFKIDCNKYITFRLQEITYGKFALLDWDQSVQESRLDDLDRRINQEVSDRIDAVSGLSVGLSGEIDNLSARLSSEISGLSVEFSGLISSVSSDITGMISSISSDLNTDLSGLSGDYVAVKDLVNRTVYDPGDSKPGVIKILDEYQYGGESGLRNYEMHMISGTVKLVKIA